MLFSCPLQSRIVFFCSYMHFWTKNNRSSYKGARHARCQRCEPDGGVTHFAVSARLQKCLFLTSTVRPHCAHAIEPSQLLFFFHSASLSRRPTFFRFSSFSRYAHVIFHSPVPSLSLLLYPHTSPKHYTTTLRSSLLILFFSLHSSISAHWHFGARLFHLTSLLLHRIYFLPARSLSYSVQLLPSSSPSHEFLLSYSRRRARAEVK